MPMNKSGLADPQLLEPHNSRRNWFKVSGLVIAAAVAGKNRLPYRSPRTPVGKPPAPSQCNSTSTLK